MTGCVAATGLFVCFLLTGFHHSVLAASVAYLLTRSLLQSLSVLLPVFAVRSFVSFDFLVLGRHCHYLLHALLVSLFIVLLMSSSQSLGLCGTAFFAFVQFHFSTEYQKTTVFCSVRFLKPVYSLVQCFKCKYIFTLPSHIKVLFIINCVRGSASTLRRWNCS